MSLKQMEAAYEQENLSLAQKAVLVRLAWHADDSGLCWPSMRTIAEKCSMSKRSVVRAVKSLEDLGLVEAQKASGRSTHYKLLTSDRESPATESHQRQRVTRGGDRESPHRCQRVTTPVTESHPNSKEHSKNNQFEPSGDSVPAKGKKKWNPDDIQIRLNALFSRRDTTIWNEKEIRAYRKIDFDPEELEEVEAWYQAELPSDSDWRRTSLATLLNNWNTDVDRARQWKKNPQTTSRKKGTINDYDKPEDWTEEQLRI